MNVNLEGHSSGPTPLFSPYPTLPAGPLAPALVNVTSEGATGLRAFWVHALGGRDGYRVTLYRSGVRVHSSRVGAQVDGASFSALTPGTEYEVEVVTQAGPLRAVAASATGWTREWRGDGEGRSGGQGRPEALLPPADRALPGVRGCLLSSRSPSGARGAAGVHAGGQCRGQPGLGQRPPGARSLPRAALRGWAPVPGAAPGPGPSPPGPEGPHAWMQPVLDRAVPGGPPPGLHTPCAAARGYAGVCRGAGHPEH